MVTEGVALTGTRDGTVYRAEPRDAIFCPPDVAHWHGATPDAAMTHFVITGARDGQAVTWLEHVPDADYDAAVKKSVEESE